MRLAIEIDEETYKDIKKGKVYSSFRDVPQESVLAIANSIPLDGVLQEIRQEIKRVYDEAGLDDYDYASGLNLAIHIIDKHIKEIEG